MGAHVGARRRWNDYATFNERHPSSFRIEKDRLVVAGRAGAPSLTCDADGVVRMRMEGTRGTMRRLTRAPSRRRSEAASERGESSPRVEGRGGVTTQTRRIAEVLVFAAIASIDLELSVTPARSC
jgi:hypothetical protein